MITKIDAACVNSNYTYKITKHTSLNSETKQISLDFKNIIEFDFNQTNALAHQFVKTINFHDVLIVYLKELTSKIKQIYINKVCYDKEFHQLPQNRNFKFYENLIKDLAHEWAIKGILNLNNNFTVNLEGHQSSHTHAKLFKSVEEYFLFNSSSLNLSKIQKTQICYSLEQSIIYSLHEPLSSHIFEWITINALADYQAGRAVTIAVRSNEHAVEITLQENYLCYTNRGERDNESIFYNYSNLEIFKIHKIYLVNLVFFKTIISSNVQLNWLEGNKIHGMKNLLALERVYEVNKSPQKVGNCAWANAKEGFYALLILSHLRPGLDQGMNEKSAFNYANKHIKPIYKHWSNFSKNKTMERFLDIIDKQDYLSDSEIYKVFSILTKISIKQTNKILNDKINF